MELTGERKVDVVVQSLKGGDGLVDELLELVDAVVGIVVGDALEHLVEPGSGQRNVGLSHGCGLRLVQMLSARVCRVAKAVADIQKLYRVLEMLSGRARTENLPKSNMK